MNKKTENKENLGEIGAKNWVAVIAVANLGALSMRQRRLFRHHKGRLAAPFAAICIKQKKKWMDCFFGCRVATD